jgi:transketolase
MKLHMHVASVKSRFLRMYKTANAGHVGSSLSVAEILSVVKMSWMNPDDDLVLSKGHAAAALYSVLAECGDISEDDCRSFYHDGTFFAAHPPPGKIPGIRFATGSLGHGLGLGAGLAFSNSLLKSNADVYVVCSDGELNEGSTWEAVMFAAQHRLSNLVCLIDWNKIQGFGRTVDVISLGDLSAKFKAFSWDTTTVNGHDVNELEAVGFNLKNKRRERPMAILCNTIKGRGFCELEDTIACHYLPMSDDQFNKMLSAERSAK